MSGGKSLAWRMVGSGAAEVWLGYVKRGGKWTALDRRSG